MDEKKRMSEAQLRLLLNSAMLVLVLSVIACIWHLIRLRLWNTLTLAGMEDIALIVTISRLRRYRSMDRDQQVRDLAWTALYSIAWIGFISQLAMVFVTR
ncbi:MAG: hypothetical protein ACP5E2_06165 [Terracidiphilus sp.]